MIIKQSPSQINVFPPGSPDRWDDLRTSIVSIRLGGASPPLFTKVSDNGAASLGVYTYAFSKGDNDQVFFELQMPHAWKAGSLLSPHIHWMPSDTGTGNCEWTLEYVWVEIGEVMGNTTVVTATQAGAGVAKTHQLAEFPAIDGTGKTLSSILLCRLARTDDVYSGDAYGLSIDFHYIVDSFGSRQEYVK